MDPARMLRGASTGTRLVVALLVGVVAAAVTVLLGDASYGPAIGWDVAAVVLLGMVWPAVWPMDADQTAAHATREDPTRPVSDVIFLAAAVASLGAVGFFLLQAHNADGATRDVLAGVGVATVALSWLVVHTVYMLRYAVLYYAGPVGGIDFNQAERPCYSDFGYLAFTLGMTFQVSDTDIRTHEIRATVLRHSLLSYLFGTVIVAATINLLAGLG